LDRGEYKEFKYCSCVPPSNARPCLPSCLPCSACCANTRLRQPLMSVCARRHCKRMMVWRKAWERCWDEVKFCRCSRVFALCPGLCAVGPVSAAGSPTRARARAHTHTHILHTHTHTQTHILHARTHTHTHTQRARSLSLPPSLSLSLSDKCRKQSKGPRPALPPDNSDPTPATEPEHVHEMATQKCTLGDGNGRKSVLDKSHKTREQFLNTFTPEVRDKASDPSHAPV
jgi:hypothetical protein